MDEIKFVVDTYHTRFFNIQDNNFFVDGNKGIERAEEIANLLIKKKVRIRFSIQCRAQDVQKELFRNLKKAGLYKAFIGFESGSQDVLNRYCKNSTVKDNVNTMQVLNELSIKCQPGYIFFDPFTTKEELQETVVFLKNTKIIFLVLKGRH